MKVEDTRIFTGGFLTQQQDGVGQRNKNTFYSFQSNPEQDKVLQKRQEAREKAMGLIKDVFAAEKAVDDDLKERAARVDEANQEIQKARDGLKDIEERKSELKKTYGITEDCQEERDLKLLEKRRDSMKPDSDIVLTEEDKERLAEIDAQGMTDYQRLSMEADASGEPFRTAMEDARKIVLEENAIIRGISLERLKSNPMKAAVKQAEEIMAGANKEIIGMLIDDAKETVDEKIEETREELEAAKEDAEEQEEQIEKIRQRNEELEAAMEARREKNKSEDSILTEIPIDRLLELDAVKTEVKQEVENILHDMKMLTEDLKGSVVDTDV